MYSSCGEYHPLTITSKLPGKNMAELEIRLKKPQNLPEVGRFTDTISLENAEQPVYMYQEEEEIEDDEKKVVALHF